MINEKKNIRLIEVGPRDGLQNEKTIINAKDKATFIRMLLDAGLLEIEATSFVRSDKIPQMGDSEELSILLKNEILNNNYSFYTLVPNEVGGRKAIDHQYKNIAIFTATSETFNKKNINASIEESLIRLRPVAKLAISHQQKIRGYISTVFGCPYEGLTSIDKLLYLIDELKKMGCFEISLGDTIGIAEPNQVQKIIERLKSHHDLSFFSMHLHDTRGMALANILVSLQNGITSFDSSAGGLGGCPYAKGSSGNVATEDVVNMLHSMGYVTGVDFEKLFLASSFILNKLNKLSTSKMYNAFKATCDEF